MKFGKQIEEQLICKISQFIGIATRESCSTAALVAVAAACVLELHRNSHENAGSYMRFSGWPRALNVQLLTLS